MRNCINYRKGKENVFPIASVESLRQMIINLNELFDDGIYTVYSAETDSTDFIPTYLEERRERML